MNPNGQLIITDETGEEKFKGKTFEETGVAKEFTNRKERRAHEKKARALESLIKQD